MCDVVLDTRFKNVVRRGRRWNKKIHGPRFFEVRINLRHRQLYFECVYRNFFRTVSNNIQNMLSLCNVCVSYYNIVQNVFDYR